MEKHQLAQELRQRQYGAGLVERRLVDALSDDDIIDSYITCSHCGAKQVTARNLEIAIERAQSASHFLELCDQLADARYKAAHPTGQQLASATRSSRKRAIKRAWNRSKR